VRRWSAVASRLQRKQMRDGLNEARRRAAGPFSKVSCAPCVFHMRFSVQSKHRGGDEQTARGQARRNQKAYEEEQLVAEALPAPALKPFMRHRVYFLSDPLE
jgi:hypothetical protein